MLEITTNADGSIGFRGRLDATQTERVSAVLDRITTSCVIDFGGLDYISSAGLGVLFATHKRLQDDGGSLKLVNLSPHIRELFSIAAFDTIFDLG